MFFENGQHESDPAGYNIQIKITQDRSMVIFMVSLGNVGTGAIDINPITGNEDYKEIFYKKINWEGFFCRLDFPIKSYLTNKLFTDLPDKLMLLFFNILSFLVQMIILSAILLLTLDDLEILRNEILRNEILRNEILRNDFPQSLL